MKEGSDSHERDGEQRTDDGDGVEDVPHGSVVQLEQSVMCVRACVCGAAGSRMFHMSRQYEPG